MSVQVENLEKNMAKLTIEVAAEEVEKAIQAAYLKEKGLELIDFKLEFGIHKGEVILGDEISPDTCRFWDSKTGEKMDKDRFRRDLGNVEEAYKEVLYRLTGEK